MSASPTNRTERRAGGPAAAGRQRPAPRLSLAVQQGDDIAGLPVARAQLRRWAAAAINADASITLRFVGHDEGLALNRDYRGRDQPTNVLTFIYDEAPPPGEPAPAGPPPVQADIVICMPVLEREARERGISLAHHLGHLVIHGVLHACGHDHEHDDEARAMESLETALLARFRIPDPYQPDGQPDGARRPG
jgi:probable rRNA maturation factor